MRLDKDRLKAADRLWRRTGVTSTKCWLYLSKSQSMYPMVTFAGKQVRANRLSAMLNLGYSLDDDAVVMHTCDNTRCWNPDHLKVGTQAENTIDCAIKGRSLLNRPTCKNGHPRSQFTAKTAKTYGGFNSLRGCKICAHERYKRVWQAKKAKLKPFEKEEALRQKTGLTIVRSMAYYRFLCEKE